VVDGDTFWLAGTRIRIADINTPEVGSPGCAAEAALGRQATARLRELLNAGPFELVSIDREEDVYGRKLRIVTRDGSSIGDALVAEGLAHYWRGHQENWC
jgi:endonuclease YncB( thermonuclease family)